MDSNNCNLDNLVNSSVKKNTFNNLNGNKPNNINFFNNVNYFDKNNLNPIDPGNLRMEHSPNRKLTFENDSMPVNYNYIQDNYVIHPYNKEQSSNYNNFFNNNTSLNELHNIPLQISQKYQNIHGNINIINHNINNITSLTENNINYTDNFYVII